jgi:hypothetical protein
MKIRLKCFLITFRIQSGVDGLQSREVKTGDEQKISKVAMMDKGLRLADRSPTTSRQLTFEFCVLSKSGMSKDIMTVQMKIRV